MGVPMTGLPKLADQALTKTIFMRTFLLPCTACSSLRKRPRTTHLFNRFIMLRPILLTNRLAVKRLFFSVVVSEKIRVCSGQKRLERSQATLCPQRPRS